MTPFFHLQRSFFGPTDGSFLKILEEEIYICTQYLNLTYHDVMKMTTNRRRNLILLHKNVISNKQENKSDETVTSVSKGVRKKTISGETLKNSFKTNGDV